MREQLNKEETTMKNKKDVKQWISEHPYLYAMTTIIQIPLVYAERIKQGITDAHYEVKEHLKNWPSHDIQVTKEYNRKKPDPIDPKYIKR